MALYIQTSHTRSSEYTHTRTHACIKTLCEGVVVICNYPMPVMLTVKARPILGIVDYSISRTLQMLPVVILNT